jgi:hypothetical protein
VQTCLTPPQTQLARTLSALERLGLIIPQGFWLAIVGGDIHPPDSVLQFLETLGVNARAVTKPLTYRDWCEIDFDVSDIGEIWGEIWFLEIQKQVEARLCAIEKARTADSAT